MYTQKHRFDRSGLARTLALACGLTALSGSALASTVVDINFSEAFPPITADPLIEGVQFFAGDAAAFEDTYTDDGASPGNPYLVSGVEGSGAVDLPGFDQTAFVGVSLASLGSAGFTTVITFNAGFFAPLPSGETITVAARSGSAVQGSASVTAADSSLHGLSITLNDLAFDELFIYVAGDFGSSFRIDDLLVNVTPNTPPPLPVPGTLLLMGAGALGLRRLAKRPTTD